ncbi:tetratricopeptide repeat protein [Aliikangiella sp. G2MR2-5]|uniref:tetratricopeptide repeat protein n=1 Tax=Aliikangiella sp. G2MR2-5 TaxID=2788943 RepID=UPI0018AC0A15|nr:hypothetical protein [Aliikangiella sp. G2MR2-5]
MAKIKITPVIAISIAVSSVFFFFYPAIFFDFVWDDVTYFNITSTHLNPDYNLDALTKPFLVSHNYYRPLVTLWLYAEADLTNTSTISMHLTNIILHCLNVALVGYLIKLLYLHINKKINSHTILIGCIFFGLHPATIEVAAWISGRFDLVLTTFLLIALVLDLKIINKVARAISVGVCFLLAALCKEMALGFALALPIWHLIVYAPQLEIKNIKRFLHSKQFAVYSAIFISGLVYLSIRQFALGYIYLPSSNTANHDLINSIMLSAKSLGLYLQILIIPFTNLSPIHAESLPISNEDPLAIFVIALLVLVLILSFFFKNVKSLGLLLSLFILSLFPVLHFISMTIGENIVQGRFLVFPLAWIILATIFLLAKNDETLLKSIKRPINAMVLLILLVNILNTKVTIPLWTNNLALWSWAVSAKPNSSEANANLAASLSNYKKYDEALKYIDKALDKKKIAKYLTIKGTILGNMGNNKEAEITLKDSLNYLMHPKDYALTLQKIATAQLQQNKKEDVLKLLGMAKKITPYSHSLYLRYYQYYIQEKNQELAKSSLEKAISLSYGEQKSYYTQLLTEQFLSE